MNILYLPLTPIPSPSRGEGSVVGRFAACVKLARSRRLPMKKIAFGLAAALLCAAAFAGEDSVKKALEARFPGKVESVQRTPYGGLYEAHLGSEVIYTDETATWFVAGQLFDGKTMKNITQESASRYNAQQFTKLPLDLAAKTVKGNGKRILVTFEDPNCGYCKKLAHEIAKLDNLTVYTFLLPVLGPDSVEKSKTIWCAANRGKAWTDWMLDGKLAASKDCKWPYERLMELGQKFRINGTPGLLFADGEMVPGYLPSAQLEQKLAKAGK